MKNTKPKETNFWCSYTQISYTDKILVKLSQSQISALEKIKPNNQELACYLLFVRLSFKLIYENFQEISVKN